MYLYPSLVTRLRHFRHMNTQEILTMVHLINILQKALSQAKIEISIEPCNEVNVPVYLHKTDELYEWPVKKIKILL